MTATSDLLQMESLTEVAEGVIVRPMLPIDRAIDEYLDDLAAQRYSAKTREDYGRYLRKFADTVPAGWDVAKITDTQIRTFRRRYADKADTTQGNVYSALRGLFEWLVDAGKIRRSPMEKQKPPRRKRPEDREVLTVPTEHVVRMLDYRSGDWTERLAVAVLAGVGPRRGAASKLRRRDYDPGSDERQAKLRFYEKGGKVVWKPIDNNLRDLIDAAIAAGKIVEDDDYLIPSRAAQRRTGDRDDRIIWRAVADVAAKCGVAAHPHALRRAFAVYYLEQNPDDIATLKELLGHRSIEVTLVYLRARNRDAAMERGMRRFSWRTKMESKPEAEKEGFEPSFEANPLLEQDSPHLLRDASQWN